MNAPRRTTRHRPTRARPDRRSVCTSAALAESRSLLAEATKGSPFVICDVSAASSGATPSLSSLGLRARAHTHKTQIICNFVMISGISSDAPIAHVSFALAISCSISLPRASRQHGPNEPPAPSSPTSTLPPKTAQSPRHPTPPHPLKTGAISLGLAHTDSIMCIRHLLRRHSRAPLPRVNLVAPACHHNLPALFPHPHIHSRRQQSARQYGRSLGFAQCHAHPNPPGGPSPTWRQRYTAISLPSCQYATAQGCKQTPIQPPDRHSHSHQQLPPLRSRGKIGHAETGSERGM